MITLGLDLGTNSLGWALIETNGEPGQRPQGRIVNSGVRIFSQAQMAGRDPQTKASLAVVRREARSARRRRDRYLRRRQRLLDLLIKHGLMPIEEDSRKALVAEQEDQKKGEQEQSVYGLRARALDEALTPHQIGRALFHLNQRRGFKSNRKTDKKDNDKGKIDTAISALEEQMMEDSARTFGEWLHMRRRKGLSVRARLTADGAAYQFYPSRAELEREFRFIMSAQSKHHPILLSDDVIEAIQRVIFYQRPLKPVKPGKCSYNPTEERAPKAHPLFQRFRLLKEVNELALVGENQQPIKLTPDERNALILALRTDLTKTGKRPFSKLKKDLKLGKEIRFNKESESRKDLEGDVVHFRLSRPEAFGNQWTDLSLAQQKTVTEKLRTEEDHTALVAWLRSAFDLGEERAEHIADVPVPDGYGRLGESALRHLIEAMENEVDENGYVISEAAASINVYGRTNSEGDRNRMGAPELPKYQEVLERHIPPGTGEPNDPYDEQMGRISNPTVHIALNQLRRVVNAVIRKHGKPDHIAIEVGRELKLNDKQREEMNRTIGRNTRDAIGRGNELENIHKQRNTGYNRLRLKLWEELNIAQPLNRCCPYCGKSIAAHMLFNGETDVDHILPYSKTLDDSQANKIMCCAPCNRQKNNRAPADVPQWRSQYDKILARVVTLPKNKQWRFADNAMERSADEDGFLARQLTDMQYISRLALTYMAHLYDYEEAGPDGVFRRHGRVRALPGRMTEMLRRHWSLNELLPDHNFAGDVQKSKNRLDHRHHALDAIVIACTSRALIQKLASAAASAKESQTERFVSKVNVPWPSFRDDVRRAVTNIVVSHKPDHGTVSRAGYAKGRGQTAGQLHKSTAYGFTGEKDEKGNDIVVKRVSITGLKPADIMKIRTNAHGHSELRDRLWEATRDLTGKAFDAAIQKFVTSDLKFKGIRHVRVGEAENPKWIAHGHYKQHKKGYLPGGNDRFEVWELQDGKWDAEVVAVFDAHRPNFVPQMRLQNHNARKIMSLKKGDMVAYNAPDSGDVVIAVVRKFDQRNKQLYLDPHNEAGNLDKRENEKTYKPVRPTPNALKRYRPRQVRVDEIGQVFDPGPR